MQSHHLAPSVTPRPVRAANGVGKSLGSPVSRAGRTYTPSVSPIKSPQRNNGSNPFSFAGDSGKCDEALGLRPAEATTPSSKFPTAPSPTTGLRKKPIILSGDIRNLDSNFDIAVSKVQVSLSHVMATLARYGIAISSDEAQTLLYEFEENNDGGLSYDGFVDDLVQMLRQTALNKFGASRTQIKKVRLTRHLEKLSAMHARVTHELQTLLGEKLRVSWTTVRDTFRAADKERRGQLSKSVFSALCLQLQIPIPSAVLEGLVLRADPRAEGVVDYNDFLAYFGVDFQRNDSNSVSSSLVFERGITVGKGVVYGIGDPAASSTINAGTVNNTLSSPGVSSALGGGVKKKLDGASTSSSPSKSAAQHQDVLSMEQLRIVLNEKLASQYSDVKKAFLALDKDGNGLVSAAEFVRVLENFNLVVSRDEMDVLMRNLDTNGDGVIDYTEFFVRFSEVLKPALGSLKKSLQENSSLVFTGHKDVKGAHKNRHALSSPGNELKEAFSRLSDEIWRAMYVELEMSDPRKTGLVTSAELLRVLAKYLGDLPKKNFSVLFRACGSHVNQFMNYRTLIKNYRPSALDSVEFYKQDVHVQTDKTYRKSPTESLVMIWSIRVQRAQLTPAEWQGLKDTIWKADARRQGRILAVEFEAILHRFLKLSDDQVAFLCFFYEDKNLSSDQVLIRYSSFLTDYEDPGLEDVAGSDSKQQHRKNKPRPEGKGRSQPPNQTTAGSNVSRNDTSGLVGFKDADRMECEQEEKRLRDFFTANVHTLEALVSREDQEKRGFVTLETFVKFCRETNGGRWKESAATTALFSKYVAQSQLFYYRGFLLDFDQKAGLQTQALVLQDDDDDEDGEGGDRYADGQELGGSMDMYHAKEAIRHQLTTSMNKQKAVYKIFQRMDPGKSGILGYPELRRALERLEIYIDDTTARDLFAQYEDEDDDGNKVLGRVKYLQFLHAHGGRDPDKALDGMSDLSSNCSYYSAISISPRPAVRGGSMGSHRPLLASRDYIAAANAVANAIEKPRNGGSNSMNNGAAAAAAVERKIKEQLEAQGKTKWKQVARAFQQIDSDRRGSVRAGSFRKVLEEFGVLLDQEELVRLQLKYDIEQNGRIHYQEYMRHLTNSMSDLVAATGGVGRNTELLPSLSSSAASPRKAVAHGRAANPIAHSSGGLPEMLREGVRAKWKAIYSSFKTLDKQNVGRVSTAHFRQLLEWYALPVSDEMFLNLLRQFDHADDGCVDYNKFMRTCFGG